MGNSIPSISTALVFGALILKAIDLVKYVSSWWSDRDKGKAKNGIASLLLACLIGVGVVFLFKATQWADGVIVGGVSLSHLNGWSSTVLGIVVTSVGSTIYDFKKAIDNGDSAKTPPLLKAAEEESSRET